MEMMDLDLTVVNDAAIAFGHSLQHFRAVSRASLLNLLSQVGRFDELPRLETLSIRIKHPHRLVNAKFYSPVCLFPVWKLPRLRSLELEGTLAMFFDFDTLHHMPILESLVLSIESEYEPIPAASVPRLSVYPCRQLPLEIAEAAPVPDLMGEKWGDHWDLPRWKSLRLDGPPSWVFCVKWLEHLPSLETVHLTTRRQPLPPFNSTLVHFQRLPLSSSSKDTTIPPTEASTQLHPAPDYYDYENTEDSEPATAMVPLMESKLRSIVLCGPWVLSEHDLNKILTVYAPNLSRLVIDGIHAVYPPRYHPWRGEQFLRTVINAIGVSGDCGDGAGQAKEVQAEESTTLGSGIKSGSKLKYLASAYSIDCSSIQDVSGD
ncbi:hypothetical protein BGZ82_009106 [Podila clonocystis]|nr:hypothetical protein BGZ82_009106 [Podila clonocystis]